MSAATPIDVVRRYNGAYAARDVDGMLALVHEDCEFVTAHRGVMRGHEAVRGFMARQTYGVTMVPTEQRYFADGDAVVAYAAIEWRYVDSGDLAAAMTARRCAPSVTGGSRALRCTRISRRVSCREA